MADTMRAERFYADTKTVALEDVPIPSLDPARCWSGGILRHLPLRPQPDQRHLSRAAAGGDPGPRASGTIAKLGPDVTGWSEGDRVVLAAGRPCLECPNCRRGDMSNCLRIQLMAFAYDGAWAEYTVALAAG